MLRSVQAEACDGYSLNPVFQSQIMVTFIPPDLAPDADDALTDGVLRRRGVAWLFDSVLIGAAMVAWLGFATGFTVLTLGLGVGAYGMLPAIPLAYSWISIVSPLSATPGQALMGLVMLDNDSFARPTILQALLWIIGYWLSLGLLWLLFFLAIFTQRKRCLHDIVAGVVVLRRANLHRLGGLSA
jgi:uncharacterized RDD family membrane protein YckC